ncbi:hypothetical protein [Allorhizocola rhizosphaerae]|uniref:hypothetical protein n=1 Tax=Allorhizocola rhizosphaerae TaxID=1872709 RepID=UPI000E3BC879|nr:hypothetical protein [Allorhizocola rhizosphaerae]
MNDADFGDLKFTGLPDVASARLSALLGNDPALAKAARDLVALLDDAPEVTLGWGNFVSSSTASG